MSGSLPTLDTMSMVGTLAIGLLAGLSAPAVGKRLPTFLASIETDDGDAAEPAAPPAADAPPLVGRLVAGISGVLLAIAVIWLIDGPWERLVAAAGLSLALFMAATDIEHGQIPDQLSLSLVWAGLLASTAGVGPASPGSAIAGAAALYGVVAVLNCAVLILNGEVAMGWGDAKLAAGLGALLGLEHANLTLVFAVLLAMAVRGAAKFRRDGGSNSGFCRFGPYILCGATASLVLTTVMGQA